MEVSARAKSGKASQRLQGAIMPRRMLYPTRLACDVLRFDPYHDRVVAETLSVKDGLAVSPARSQPKKLEIFEVFKILWRLTDLSKEGTIVSS